jgi:NAD(P)-dependent dehydrogenase (short-subunit alcohol dehydrogenase family)
VGVNALLVTGAASGIGRAAARLAASRGAFVIASDVNGDGLGLCADDIEREGGSVLAMLCDTTDAGAVRSMFERLGDAGHTVSRVFVAAGVDAGGPAHELPLDAWRRVLEVNLTGAFLVSRQAITSMLQANVPGAIVICSSPAAFVGFASGGTSAYSASKGGVSALVRSLAIDYAHSGIRVNAVVPGPTETPLMWAAVPPGQREEARRRVLREVPLGRMADPVEPAAAALWLLSDEAAYVTGSHLVCDGGVLAKASISI